MRKKTCNNYSIVTGINYMPIMKNIFFLLIPKLNCIKVIGGCGRHVLVFDMPIVTSLLHHSAWL